LIDLLVLVARTESASDLHLEFHLEFLLAIDGADELGRIDQFDMLVELDVAGGHRAFFVHGEQECLRLAAVRLELDLLEVQDDVGHILDNPIDRGELMLGPGDLDRGDRRPFEGGEEHTAQRVADGVAVAGFKRLGDELGICRRRGALFLR